MNLFAIYLFRLRCWICVWLWFTLSI